jgi:hypothetical protein
MKAWVFSFAFTSLVAACAGVSAGARTGCPSDAVCGFVDFGGGRRIYTCASPREWSSLQSLALESRKLHP